MPDQTTFHQGCDVTKGVKWAANMVLVQSICTSVCILSSWIFSAVVVGRIRKLISAIVSC